MKKRTKWVLLALIAAGVFLIVRTCVRWSGFQTLLEEGDYSRREKALGERLGIYWCVITAAYLAVSFLTGRWDMTWVIWPVAAVAHGAVFGVARALSKRGGK